MVNHHPAHRQLLVTGSFALPPIRELIVQEYRAYFIGHDGHFIKAADLLCPDDEDAIKTAKQLIDGLSIELWQGGRQVAKFDANGE
ncbi:hypothetical protein [Bradyrhizobium sp. SYSU BS000235]|uniref:hypothetical protein n=1 Tax=Bradyrhizobium sp. SYSU BS000235 TaxID=3411332 RepID=UPI003C772150